jgi:hypothetical protein
VIEKKQKGCSKLVFSGNPENIEPSKEILGDENKIFDKESW